MKVTRENIELGINGILMSYAQIFFSNKKLFGILLILVSFFSISAGFAGLVSVITTNVIALIMGVNRQKIASGQYGFNSLLVGLGIGIYYQFNFVLFLIILFGSLLTFFFTLLFEGWLGKYKLPFLSLSFLMGYWIISLASQQFTGLKLSESGIYVFNEIATNNGPDVLSWHKSVKELKLPTSIQIYFNSLGAIFFQYNIYAGILISLGLLFASRISFMLSLLGFYTAYIYYWIVGADFTELTYSYIGFNYILTAIAIGGFFVIPSIYSFVWVILLTPLISFLITASNAVLTTVGLSTFSLPFNIVVILFLYALNFRERYFNRPQLVGLQKFSAEQNLYAHKHFKQRFQDKAYINLSLPFFGQWKINQAHDGAYTHKGEWKHAWDFVIEEDGKEYKNNGDYVEDFYCYNKSICAPADGYVEAIDDGIADNNIGEVNLDQNWGNSIVIKHGVGVYSQLSHIKASSFKVQVGDSVKKGEVLAQVGNSGRSPSPHLHMQIQATPYIGSATFAYPLGQYFLIEKDDKTLHINEIPKKDSIIENIELDHHLKKAFGFIPGQKIEFQGELEKVQWEVGIDYYNNTYLYSEDFNAYAYFVANDNEVYFTEYVGSKKALLYQFYLAAYHVVFTFHQGVTIEDIMPANSFIRGPRKWIQDFIAPFYIYTKPKFIIDYIEQTSYFDESVIKIKTQCKSLKNGVLQSEFLIDKYGFKKWVIYRDAQQFEYNRLKK